MQKTGPNENNAYYNNLIHSTTYCGIFLNEQFEVSTGGISVYHNIFVNCASSGYAAIFVAPVYDTPGYEIYNNTIYGSGDGIVIFDDAEAASTVWNNLLINASPLLQYYSGGYLPSYSDYNQFHDSSPQWTLNSSDYNTIGDWRTATGLDAHSVTTDPGVDNAGGVTAADYQRSSYPEEGRGGGYASVIGAWLGDSDPVQIGYLSSSVTASFGSASGSVSISGGAATFR